MSVQKESLGQGPDLALLHGWGMSSLVWQNIAGELAQHFTVHLVDLPGYGSSATIDPYDLENTVGALSAALPMPLYLCGWSFGGQLAMAWAIRQPQSIKRLVVLSSTPSFTARDHIPWATEKEVLEDFAQNLESECRKTLLRFLSLQAQGDHQAKAVLQKLRHTLPQIPNLLILKQSLRLLIDTDLSGEIKNIATPTLIIHGENDTLAPVQGGYWLQDQIRGSVLKVLEKTAHVPFLSKPQEIIDDVLAFCNASDDGR